MKLIDVLSAHHASNSDIIICEIVADIGEGEETMPFGWHPKDKYGLGPAVTEWFKEHPGFPIGGPENDRA